MSNHQVGAHSKHQQHGDLCRQSRVRIVFPDLGHLACEDHRCERDQTRRDDSSAEGLPQQRAHRAQNRHQGKSAQARQWSRHALALQTDEQPEPERDPQILKQS
jgi:hypothetical protein